MFIQRFPNFLRYITFFLLIMKINESIFYIDPQIIIMASFFTQTSVINNIASSLLMPKRSVYSQNFMHSKIEIHSHIQYQNVVVLNSRNQKLKTTIFNHKKTQEWDACILFLHGYGSNKIESVNLLHVLPKKHLLISFDFSGSGKSDGQLTTFGIKQSEDIRSILKFAQQNYIFKKLILWGRSMGAVACLLHTCKYQGVDLQVIDSPFSSFQKIAKQWAQQQMQIPSLFTYLGVQILKQKFKSHQHNPFEIQLARMVRNCKAPALFIYCEKDSIISAQNSLDLLKQFKFSTLIRKRYQSQGCRSIVINQNHNEQRKKMTLNRIFRQIQRFFEQSQRHFTRSASQQKIRISIQKTRRQRLPFNAVTYSSLQKTKENVRCRSTKGLHQVVSKEHLLKNYAYSTQNNKVKKTLKLNIFQNQLNQFWDNRLISSFKFRKSQKDVQTKP